MNFQQTLQLNVDSIRASADSFMIDTCVIRRKTGSTIVDGQDIPVYASGITSKCRLIVRSGSESTNIAAQQRLTAQSQFTGLYRMQLPLSIEIDVDDHIEFTDTVTGQQFTFEVIFAPTRNNMTGAFIVTLQDIR